MALSHVSAADRPGPDWAVQDSWSYHDLDRAPLSGECRDELERLRLEVDEAFFKDPAQQLSGALRDPVRRAAALELATALLGSAKSAALETEGTRYPAGPGSPCPRGAVPGPGACIWWWTRPATR